MLMAYRNTLVSLCVAQLIGFRTITAQSREADSGKASGPAPAQDAKRSDDLLGVSIRRMSSGTAWIPDAVPMPMRDFTVHGWGLMLSGVAFGQYDAQAGPRGGFQAGSLNWGMLMASH